MSVHSSRIRLAALAAGGAWALPKLLGGAGTARAQATPTAADPLDALPLVDIIATDFDFEMPTELSAGWTRLHLRNWGAEDHHAQLLRLHDDVTFGQLVATFQEQGEAALALVDLAGGPGTVHSGSTSEAVVLLEPGEDAVACFIDGPADELHITMGMLTPLTVIS